MIGLPSPLPFYADLLAIFLVSTGLGFVPAIRDPRPYRFYLRVVAVFAKLIVASLLTRLWFIGVVPATVLLAGLTNAAIAVSIAWGLLGKK